MYCHLFLDFHSTLILSSYIFLLQFIIKFYERVKLEVAAFGGIIRECEFGAEVELELLFPENQAQPFLDRLTDMTSGTVEGMETGQEYRAFPV